jgi:hypothetical protein
MFTVHGDMNGGKNQYEIALKAWDISAMGVSPWIRYLKLTPGFGRKDANWENEVSPKR